MSLEEIQAEVFQLEPKERAELARQILLSLEPDFNSDIERSWAEETERRYQLLKSAEVLRPLLTAPDPLQIHPEISRIRFHEDPKAPLDPEDWPEPTPECSNSGAVG